MSPELWTVVGVVIGGALATVGQLVADVNRQSAERRQWQRDQMVSAYSALLAGASEALLHGSFNNALVEHAGENRPSHKPFPQLMEESIALVARCETAAARIHVVAPEDTAEAADKIVQVMLVHAMQAEKKSIDDYRDVQRAFVLLAKRDLEL